MTSLEQLILGARIVDVIRKIKPAYLHIGLFEEFEGSTKCLSPLWIVFIRTYGDQLLDSDLHNCSGAIHARKPWNIDPTPIERYS